MQHIGKGEIKCTMGILLHEVCQMTDLITRFIRKNQLEKLKRATTYFTYKQYFRYCILTKK